MTHFMANMKIQAEKSSVSREHSLLNETLTLMNVHILLHAHEVIQLVSYITKLRINLSRPDICW